MKAKLKSKRAAIDLSIGTVVIIVLAMSMLILGIILIKNIFSGATDSVKQIDQGVKNEINKLFTDNQDRKLVLFPSSGIIKLEQGSQDAGFAISIRNTEDNPPDKTLSYKVTTEGKGSCTSDPTAGTNSPARIITGDQGTITLPPNTPMENPIHVRFAISDTAPTCTFRVKVAVTEGTSGGSAYGSPDFMDIEIIPK